MSHTRTRRRNLILAGGLAVAAAALTALYLGRDHGATARAAAPVATAPVLVAVHDLSVGTSLSQALASGSLAVRRVDRESISPGALVDVAAARADVVLQPVYAGEQVLSRRVGPSGAAGLPSQLAGALRVFQISGTADQLLAASVRAGDHVDVVASVKSGPDQTPYTQVVLRNILVVRAPTDGDSSSGQMSATMQLTDRQAERLFYVQQNGDWSLLLRPAARSTDVPTKPASAASVLQGS